jgi:hypothetical protein
MNDDQAVQPSRKPYHPPVIDDLGSLRDLTAGGGGFQDPVDGVNNYGPAAPPAPGS